MITVYGIRGLHASRLRAILLKKGLNFQHVSVNLGKRSETFENLTAVGKIPILEDEDGTVVWDSVYITDYLDYKYPHTYRMIPKDPKQRAAVLNVVALCDRISSFMPPMYVEKFGLEEAMKKNGVSHRAFVYDSAQKEDLKKEIAYRLNRLKKLYGGREFLAGAFSFADAATLACIKNLEFLEFDVSQWKEWTEKMLKDSVVAQMFAPEEEKGIKEI